MSNVGAAMGFALGGRLRCLNAGLLALSLAAAGVWGPASVARADANEAGALVHFHSAQQHYAAGRYDEALTDLEAAIALDPNSPTLAFNAGRVAELVGNLQRAIAHFRRAETLLPPDEAEQRARIRSTIRRLEGAQARTARHAHAPAAAPPLREYVVEHGVADGPFWVAFTASAVLFTVSMVTGIVANAREAEFEAFVVRDVTDNDVREQLRAQADDTALASDVLLAACGAAATTAVFLYALRERVVVRELPAASPFVTASGRGLAVGLRAEF